MAGKLVQGFGENVGDSDDRLDRVLTTLDELDDVIYDGPESEALVVLRNAIRTLTDEVRDIRGGLVSASESEPRKADAPAAPHPRSVPVDPNEPNVGSMKF
ncbi:hypothetical protein [Curtobacterium sp. MCBA15_001]|uniref:hypothetical protein n=1 Tax=Curtobacterium sp. MCBA15_001 TaxID=1898731 RepID=UPI0008DD1128|nr:hypothetical protein [Curtobacterium sp. MCBA15_001]OIH95107.1 hypothetical protein BIU90_02925 [Curtobacterium sp. MCBA15_001]